MCVCVAEVWTRLFPALKCFVLYMEVGLEAPKRTETREKSSCKISPQQVEVDLKKIQKQGRDEITQEDCLHLLCIFPNVRSSSCVLSSLSALFLYFSQIHPYLKWSFAETFFPWSYTLFTHNFLNRLLIGFVAKQSNCFHIHTLTSTPVMSKGLSLITKIFSRLNVLFLLMIHLPTLP